MSDSNSTSMSSKLKKLTRSLSVKKKVENKSTNSGKKPDSKSIRKLDPENWFTNSSRSTPTNSTPETQMRIVNSVSDKKSLWADKVNQHEKKQALNPFSDRYNADLHKLNKEDPSYGQPDSTSLSAKRAKDGEANMRREICDVCDAIYHHGRRSGDGKAIILFGHLFTMYSRINDKVVGLLIRAKKKQLLHFEGEMLYQVRDNASVISLIKNINTIRAIFGRDPIPGGGHIEQEIEVVQQDIVVEVEDEPKPAAADNKHEKDDHNGDESRDSVGLKSSLKSLKQSFRRLVKPVVTKRKESKEERNIPKEDSKNVENSINITNIKDNKDSHAGESCSSNRRMRTISIHYADEMCDHQEVTEVQVLQEDVIIEDNCEQKDEGEVNDKQEKQSPWKKIFNSSRKLSRSEFKMKMKRSQSLY